MPCGCNIKQQQAGTKKLILRNPKTGKVVATTTVPKMVPVRSGPQLLPGHSRIIKPETMMKYVMRPRKFMI